jgi:predicted aspartyl protease
MTHAFDPQHGLIIVGAELAGPSGSVLLRLALDTGATSTLINVAILVSIGYDPALAPDRMQVTTGSGVEYVPRITLNSISALGQELADYPVLCHTLPPSANVDGLLGLDFFRNKTLTLDFFAGQISLR